MTISIITATFNSAATLKDTLDSILAQTFDDYEVIVKDGMSKDGTERIVMDYMPRFDGRLRWCPCPDKGIYDAMNQGIALATGDIVGVLNSDDFYADSHVLQDIAEAFENHSIDCVYGNLVYVDAVDTTKVVRRWQGSQYQPGCFQKGWHPAHPTFYVKRELFGRLGVFDTSFQVSADFELMLRFLEANRVSSLYINRCFVRMRFGGESSGTVKNVLTGNRNILKAFKKNGLQAPPFYMIRRLAPKIAEYIKNRIKK